MSTSALRRGLTLAALVPLLAGLAACGGDDDPGAERCVLPTADPSAAPLEGLPSLDGSVLYGRSTQGKTQVVFALVNQGDFVKVRDDLKDRIEAAGWRIDGTDQETVEAEAQFSKAAPLQEGSIKVEPLAGCDGYVTVRYRLSS